jgi:hypothetical protein
MRATAADAHGPKDVKALHSGLDRRRLFVLDALRYSLVNEARVFARLSRQLRRIGRLPPGTTPKETLALDALSSAWQLVDTVYRVRQLLRQVRGLEHKSPPLQLFLRGTIAVEEFRHLFQHLDSAIPRITGRAFPIMGVISWATPNPMLSCTMTVGHWGPETHAHTLALDTWTGAFVNSIRLDAGTASLDLTSLHRATRKLATFLERWLRQQRLVTKISSSASIFRFGIVFPSTPYAGN